MQNKCFRHQRAEWERRKQIVLGKELRIIWYVFCWGLLTMKKKTTTVLGGFLGRKMLVLRGLLEWSSEMGLGLSESVCLPKVPSAAHLGQCPHFSL